MAGNARRTLRNVAIFRNSRAEALAGWEAHCRWKTFGAGERILEANEESRDVFFLIEGRAQVVIYSAAGRVVPFRDIAAGGMFGEFAAIDDKRRSASVEATETCLVGCMAANNFKKLLKGDNAVAMALLEHAIAQVRTLTDRIFEFSTLAVKNRIQAELVRLAQQGERKGSEVHICPFPRHIDIANRVSTHREAVTRELACLRRMGIVRREGKVFIIIDLEALKRKVREVADC